MSGWPSISEPELLERLAMDDEAFLAYMGAVIGAVPHRACDAETIAFALGYPWTRPQGSYRLTDDGAQPLAEMAEEERERALREFASAEGGRLPILAIGSNGSPEALGRKFGHFEDPGDRTVLALAGRLHEFDVGVAANPALYGAMPATLFPSPGTSVSSTLLWVTPTQFTQLTWSEISYRLGRLATRFDVDDGETSFDEVLAFVSRWGAFCVEGRPVALAAVPATGRVAAALTQEQVLDAAAALAIGPEANAEALIRAIFEDMPGIAPKLVETVNRESRPFESERWTPFDADG